MTSNGIIIVLHICPYCRLYIDSSRHNEEVKTHLCVGEEGGVVLCDYGDIWEDVTSLVKGMEGKIWVSMYQEGGREGGKRCYLHVHVPPLPSTHADQLQEQPCSVQLCSPGAASLFPVSPAAAEGREE